MRRTNVIHIQKVGGISGSEKHLLSLLPLLDKTAFAVSLVIVSEVRNRQSEWMTSYIRQLRNGGVAVHLITVHADVDPWLLWRVYRVFRQEKPDIVHTHLIHGDLYGTVAAKCAGVRHVISTKHGYDSYGKTSHLYRLNKILAPFVSRIITISNALQPYCAEVEGIPISKMTAVHYGYDPPLQKDENHRRSIRADLGVSENTFLIGTVGRLVEVKGHRYLFGALARLGAQKNRTKLLVIGEGKLRRSLEDLASSLGIRKDVVFLGFRHDVSDLLAAIDLFVLPTLGEGFGLAVLEAMAHRKPVIATSVMAIPEIVEHGVTGLLVPPRDESALSDAIGKLMADEEVRRRMGEAGHERLIRYFSIERMVRRTEDTYREVLGSHL